MSALVPDTADSTVLLRVQLSLKAEQGHCLGPSSSAGVPSALTVHVGSILEQAVSTEQLLTALSRPKPRTHSADRASV